MLSPPGWVEGVISVNPQKKLYVGTERKEKGHHSNFWETNDSAFSQ